MPDQISVELTQMAQEIKLTKEKADAADSAARKRILKRGLALRRLFCLKFLESSEAAVQG